MNDTKWVSMWGNAMSIAEHHPEGYAKDLTLRYPVYAPFSGSALRFTLDNYCGKEPVTIHRATVAVCDSDLTGKVPLSCPLAAGTIRDITFDGSHSVTLAAGASATSDALSFPVSAGQTLCVSLYFGRLHCHAVRRADHRSIVPRLFFLRRPDAQRSAAPCHLQGDKLVLFS